MLNIGDKIPSAHIKLIADAEVQDVETKAYFSKGLIVLFTVPGSFTPTCHNDHLPGFSVLHKAFQEAGVEKIVCATANDHHVTMAWANARNVVGQIEFLADFDARFAKLLGVDQDKSNAGLGLRYSRTAWIIQDGEIRAVFLEEKPGDLQSTSAQSVLAALRTQ